MARRIAGFCPLLIFVLCAAAAGQSVTYNRNQYPSKGFPGAQADLNGDGVLDLVTIGSGPSGKSGFYLTLSNPDGSYQSSVFYTSPYSGGAVSLALGDFNNDGKVDVAEVESTRGYYIFFNKGDGTLLPSWNFATSAGSINSAIVAADFNGDGKLDLIIFDGARATLDLLYGSGYGSFSAPFAIATNQFVDNLFIGDYDSDGKADLAATWAHCDRGAGCATHVNVYYGSGKGNFSSPISLNYSQDFHFTSDNVNSDQFSDLLGVSGSSATLRILYGNANRTFTVRDIALAASGTSPVAVDLNGDGINDLALIENQSGVANIAVLLGNLDGSYEPEQLIYSSSTLAALTAGRYDRDTKPDLMAWNALDASAGNGYFEFLHNTTTGDFPSCAPPNAETGITVCAPGSGSMVSSPANLAIGASFTSPLRKTEVWIDGDKVAESFNSYTNYSFFKDKLIFPAGQHRADVYTATYDNRLQHVTVSFTVAPVGAAQYQVSLFSAISFSGPPTGQVAVDSNGQTTVRLDRAAANTSYALQFCPAPAQNYPTCLDIGTVSTDAAGNANTSMPFPTPGPWAGDFQLVSGATPQFMTNNMPSTPGQVYFATLQFDSTVNGKGTWMFGGVPPPQDRLASGTLEFAYGLIQVRLTGASPKTAYSATQCPRFFGSDCYLLYTHNTGGFFTTDGNGNVNFSVATDGIGEDIFSVDPSKNAFGFLAGFQVP